MFGTTDSFWNRIFDDEQNLVYEKALTIFDDEWAFTVAYERMYHLSDSGEIVFNKEAYVEDYFSEV